MAPGTFERSNFSISSDNNRVINCFFEVFEVKTKSTDTKLKIQHWYTTGAQKVLIYISGETLRSERQRRETEILKENFNLQ